MKVKSIALTVAILAAVTAAVWYWQRDRDSGPVADARVGQTLLDAATVARIGGMTLVSGGNTITLNGIDPAALKAGVVKEYHDLPADYAKVARVIEDLLKPESRITRFLSARPDRIEKLGFKGDRIELRDRDGKVFWTLHLGDSQERGGRFIKYGDESKAYLSGLALWIDTNARSWAEAALIGAKGDDVVGIEVVLPSGETLAATRVDGRGVWKSPGLAEGESPKDAEWTTLAGKLAGLRFLDTGEPLTADAIAGRPGARRYTVTLADGRIFKVVTSQRLEAPPVETKELAEGETPPAPQAPPADVWVSSSRAEDAVNSSMTRRGFQIAEWVLNGLASTREALVNPPAPAAAPAPSATEETAPIPQAAPGAP